MSTSKKSNTFLVTHGRALSCINKKSSLMKGVYETTYGMNMSSTYIFALIVVKKMQISMSIRWNSCPNHYIVAVPLTYSTIWRSFFIAMIKSFSSIWTKIDTKNEIYHKKVLCSSLYVQYRCPIAKLSRTTWWQRVSKDRAAGLRGNRFPLIISEQYWRIH